MSLTLLIDEDAQDKVLIKLLRQANHQVTTANEAGLMGQPDSTVLDHARNTNHILLTLNCRDFQALHLENFHHPRILAVYQEANSSKKMSFKSIVRAIANLETANILLANQFIALNHWNY